MKNRMKRSERMVKERLGSRVLENLIEGGGEIYKVQGIG